MTVRPTDPTAASIHAARAEKHYQAAASFRRLGLAKAAAEAEKAARDEDEVAYILRTGREPRRA